MYEVIQILKKKKKKKKKQTMKDAYMHPTLEAWCPFVNHAIW